MSGEMAEQDIDDAITYGDLDSEPEEFEPCDICGELSDDCFCGRGEE